MNTILYLILAVLAAYIGYNYYTTYINTKTTTTTGTTVIPGTTTTISLGTDNNVYAVVDDVAFIQNQYSFGNVLASFENCNSVIQCSNYLFNERTSGGANYIPDIKRCELLTTISPIGVNQQYSNTLLILRSGSKLANGINAWTKNDTVTSSGDLYCSANLAYRDYAKTLCANIPYCKAYTYEVDNNGSPFGCLKVSNTTVPNDGNTVKNVSFYTGTRTDSTALPTDYVYNFDMNVSSGTPMINQSNIDLATCALLTKIKSAPYSVWSYALNGGGNCQLYSDKVKQVKASNSILISYIPLS